MLQFIAILKDSFREAVDGFVIYAMLVMSALVIALLGSISFTPEPPKEALDQIVKQFPLVFPDKGFSRAITPSFENSFSAADVQPAAGGYKLRVAVSAQRKGVKDDPVEMAGGKSDKPAGDSFRETVLLWSRPAERVKDVEAKGQKIQLAQPGSTSIADQRAVPDDLLCDFIKNQFAIHAGMSATVTRAATGVEEPRYEFDVTTTGGSAVRGWPHKVSLFFGAWTLPVPFNLGSTLFWIQDRLVNGLGAVLALLISIVITAFFIPNMLRKGSIDLLISKPIGRSQLLVYKYIGGLTFMFLVTTFTVGGVWLVLALRSGVWDPKFLVVIPVLTFTFAILYAVSTFAAVFTRSAIVSILLSVGFAFFLYVVGQVKSIFDAIKTDEKTKNELPEWSFTLVDTLNNILPRYKDLDKLTTKVLSEGTLTPAELRMRALDLIDYPSWGSTFGVSLAFIVLMLTLSCWRLSRRDY
ncbi:ABC-2 family transporter protein [Gemmata sp. SH-PL17]|uniref:ABC transporter permease n=1 Tax=Gemmata sp. SH-PL17 TaxID=1630693 RepID=UPI00078B7450|nr:ABC transporter permease [Gemmata sp. SH-PL17]AMV23144.1 ABC-2 family transporter protein [Gemmata sp. SH-PL17]